MVWLLANCGLLAAAGLRLRERGQTPHDAPEGRFIVTVAGGLASLFLAMSVGFGIHERVAGNETERSRLSGVAFKKGPICASEDPIPRAIVGANRILEINAGRLIYPVDSPSGPLEWGVPVVRMNGLDYSLLDEGTPLAIFARAASGESNAKLEATEERVGDHVSFEGLVRLKMSAGTAVLFDQTWKREHLYIYCPDYQHRPRSDQNPRKMIMAAMNIDAAAARDAKQPIEIALIADAEVVESADQGFACPAGVRIPVDLQRSNPETLWLGQPVQIGGGYYFPGLGARAQVVCAGEVVYVFGLANSYPKLSVMVQKWRLNGSRMQWSTRMLVSDKATAMSAGWLVVRSAREKGGLLHVRLADKSGKSVRFAVPITQD